MVSVWGVFGTFSIGLPLLIHGHAQALLVLMCAGILLPGKVGCPECFLFQGLEYGKTDMIGSAARALLVVTTDGNVLNMNPVVFW